MKELKIKLDLFNGPIWKEYYNLESDAAYTSIKVVDEDEQIRKLDCEAQQIFMSFYNLGTDNSADIFDKDKAKMNKGKLIELIFKIKLHLSKLTMVLL
ncbi:MAG: hypothetical protein WBO70_06300 [Erysipelotrichaceae bacterium]